MKMIDVEGKPRYPHTLIMIIHTTAAFCLLRVTARSLTTGWTDFHVPLKH